MRISAPQSHLRYPLTRLLGNGGSVRVLRALTMYGGPLGVVQLARDTGLTPPGTRQVLGSLVSQGIVSALGQKGSQLYSINAAQPFSGPLKALFAEEQSRWNRLLGDLRETLKGRPQVIAAWLYGSVARGEDGPASDIDIALAIDGDTGDVANAVRDSLRPLEDREQVSVSVVAFSTAELLARASGNPWWSELVRDAKSLKAGSPEQVVARLRREASTA